MPRAYRRRFTRRSRFSRRPTKRFSVKKYINGGSIPLPMDPPPRVKRPWQKLTLVIAPTMTALTTMTSDQIYNAVANQLNVGTLPTFLVNDGYEIRIFKVRIWGPVGGLLNLITYKQETNQASQIILMDKTDLGNASGRPKLAFKWDNVDRCKIWNSDTSNTNLFQYQLVTTDLENANPLGAEPFVFVTGYSGAIHISVMYRPLK